MIKKISFIFALAVLISASSCSGNKTGNISQEKVSYETSVSENNETSEYETAMFRQCPGPSQNLVDLVPVRYYVNDGVLYTSEKYHFILVGYAYDADNSDAYRYTLFFNKDQEKNSDGWYSYDFKSKEIPRMPATHVSSLVLKNYYGPLQEEKCGVTWADAVLYNKTDYIFNGTERDTFTPQLQKLMSYVK